MARGGPKSNSCESPDSTNLKESAIKIVNTISGCEKINFGLANMVVSRGAESRATLI